MLFQGVTKLISQNCDRHVPQGGRVRQLSILGCKFSPTLSFSLLPLSLPKWLAFSLLQCYYTKNKWVSTVDMLMASPSTADGPMQLGQVLLGPLGVLGLHWDCGDGRDGHKESE